MIYQLKLSPRQFGLDRGIAEIRAFRGHDVKFCNNAAFQCPFRLQKLPTLSQLEQSSITTLPSYRPKKRKSFTAKHFRLCYFKSFCLIFTKLYVLSYLARISAVPQFCLADNRHNIGCCDFSGVDRLHKNRHNNRSNVSNWHSRISGKNQAP